MKSAEKPTLMRPDAFRMICAIALGMLVWIVLTLTVGITDSKDQLLRIYGCVVISLLLMLGAYYALERLGRDKAPREDGVFMRRLIVVIAVALVVMSVAFMVVSNVFSGLFTIAGIGRRIAFCGIAVVLAALTLGMLRNGGGARLFWIGSCILSVASAGLYTYTPNLLNQANYVYVHYTALSHSLYHVAFQVPYTMQNSSTYGHYAIFFWPFLKVFGHSPQVVTLLFVFSHIIAQILFLYLVSKITPNYLLRGLAALGAMCIISRDFYPAVFPTRILWPMILLAYMMRRPSDAKSYRRYWIIGYVLCGLACTWNLDSGTVATIVYTVSIWLHYLQGRRIFSREMLRVYAMTLLGMLASIFEMVAIVNLYNVLCGGELSLRVCFFPLVGAGDTSYANLLQVSLASNGYGWFVPVGVFVLEIAIGMFSCLVARDGTDSKRQWFVIFGVMGLGQSYFFLNRGIASWTCVVLYFIFGLLLLSQIEYGKNWKQGGAIEFIPQAVAATGIIYLCVLVTITTVQFSSFLATKLDTKLNSMESLQTLAEEVKRVVPKDTYAYGAYTQEVYALLGWDPGYYMRDPVVRSQYHLEGDDETKDQINEQDSILVHVNDMGVIQNSSGLVPVCGIPAEEPVFYLLQRFDYQQEAKEEKVLVEQRDIPLTANDSYQIAAVPIEIKKNTYYKVELTLADTVDFKTAAGLVVDFFAVKYDNPEQEAHNFAHEGKYQYTFYFNSGELENDTLDVLVRAFVWDLSSEVDVSLLRVTELEYA